MKLFKCYIVGLNVKCGRPPNLVTKIKVTEEFEDCWSKKQNNNNNNNNNNQIGLKMLWILMTFKIEGGKKIKKLIKSRKLKINNWKNQTVKKNRLKFWKNRPVRFAFGFRSLKLKKPIRTEPKPKKIESNQKNRSKPVWTSFCPKNWTEPKPVSFLTGFGSVLYFF